MGIHAGRSGHQKCVYPVIAIMSATPVTTQHAQYVQPVTNPAHGPIRSRAMSAKVAYLWSESSSSPRVRMNRKRTAPMIM